MNWTLVTAYFDLTKYPEASNEIKSRDFNYYLNHAKDTLTLDQNLVIYCEADKFDEIKKVRDSIDPHENKTKYYIKNFNDWFTQGEREKILLNRQTHPYNFDPRNTASYYLFCVSRYKMLVETIDTNPFNTTHFAWINFCVSRMGKGVGHLNEALSVNRDRFSTCYIDYIPQNLINNIQEYWKYGRCSMCSGFFTGNAYYMKKVCTLILEKFYHYLSLGYGHADEQLYSPVYFEQPELFEHYYGDYQSMITNYVHSYEDPEKIVGIFIQNSYRYGDYKKCLEACKFVEKSIKDGKCQIQPNYYEFLKNKIGELTYLLNSNFQSPTFQLPASIDVKEYQDVPGKEHYRMLEFLSQNYLKNKNSNVIIDIGTHRGSSALALANNNQNMIYTFDIVDKISYCKQAFPNNIVFCYDDLFDESVFEDKKELILKAPLLFIDVDPHNGSMENAMYDTLKKYNYQGVVVWDDIHYFKEMKEIFWNKVPHSEKFDVTHIGHWSGTGITSFDKKKLVEMFELLLNWKF